MAAEMGIVVTSGLGAVLFAAVFLAGDRIHLLGGVLHDPRSTASVGAGVSAAYVFIHLMPELAEAREALAASAAVELRYEGMAVYFVALAAFVAYYGLEHFRRRARTAAAEAADGGAFRLQMAGWAAYVIVAAYLLVQGLGDGTSSIVLYAVAIAFHLLAADHGFRREHGAAYTRKGSLVLAGAALAGWMLGLFVALPTGFAAALVAFVSGAVIVNSAIMELPTEKDGRFAAFAIGSLLYSLILVPLS
jgi:hypothetical protein